MEEINSLMIMNIWPPDFLRIDNVSPVTLPCYLTINQSGVHKLGTCLVTLSSLTWPLKMLC